jgi:hypothetical protein
MPVALHRHASQRTGRSLLQPRRLALVPKLRLGTHCLETPFRLHSRQFRLPDRAALTLHRLSGILPSP